MTTLVEFYVSSTCRRQAKAKLLEHFSSKACVPIELGIFEYSKQFCISTNVDMTMAKAIYNDTVANVIYNCEQDNKTIRSIKAGIANKTFNPYNIAFLRPEELDADGWEKIIARKNTTEDKLTNLPTIKRKPCSVCEVREHFYYQLQTRSCDEPVTTFYVCKGCGKTTRVNK